MSYFLAIDGGQSKTLALIADEAGHIYGCGKGGPSNHLHQAGAIERCRESLQQAILGAAAEAKLDLNQTRFTCAGLGLTGVSSIVPELVKGMVSVDTIAMEGDAVTTWLAATGGAPGAIIIAGTGSIAFAQNQAGERAVAGGWGYIMGDEGSGYWVAREALAAACRGQDGRGAATVLQALLPRAAGLADLWELHRRVYSQEWGRSDIARLAPAVCEGAKQGDAVAVGIIRAAARELARAAVAVLRKTGMDTDGEVFAAGGLFECEILLRMVEEETCLLLPKVTVKKSQFPPVVGSLFLAYQAVGVPVNSVVGSIRKQLGGSVAVHFRDNS
ncbi:MAG TPA: hypothetical protein GXX55_03705 [Firmicutes bacterium]|nr:hypothetical protein [Bacillota bacterium]